ncbi:MULTISPECIES: acyl-CoA dehydrogenase family protein [Prauserella salsuginis group]|uniref:Acyl-CoA dehydrogenase n=2 Tax=Prauserella salsuginis group TaxID=2893672 RepID=A0A839XZT3_9PSEU|nr:MULTISPECIES: acyl-CoA dehydrogenase family protein [Prauserella salsuginis group]MBB3665546.1 acyl-CoA dehydrogenase [Prauserella sediminis]MCR3718756.1 acyl-CoA dehydrogenase [Prauserella flava]MCR3733326.1 acyl-CoA dehydrogenase [Prauserella salsuginis]
MDFALTDEQEAFRKTVREWVEKECPKEAALELEKQEFEYPHELFARMAEVGFHGIGIDEAYGGSGGTELDQVILIRELARSLGGIAWIWGINAFAGAKSVGYYGTEEQKRRLLPQVADGSKKFAISVTEPAGGTDLLGVLATTATRSEGGWVINGQKIWSTQAHVADYLLLLARTEKNPAKKTGGTTLFLVPREAEGVECRQIPKLGMKNVGSCEVFLDDVFVPDELVLGDPGQAWYMLLKTLNNERIVMSALALGILDGVIEEAKRYLDERDVFGKKLGRMQVLQHYYADMLIAQKSAELLIYEAAWRQAEGLDCGMQANMAKIVASEGAVTAADRGIQIFGGMGYALETQMQRYWRDARLYRIGPIANEMARNSIAEMAGLPRSF